MTFTFPLPGPIAGSVAAQNAGVTITNLALTSTDPTVFTAAVTSANEISLTLVAAGTATLSATATGSDGSSLTGSVTVVVTAAPDSLVFTFPGFTGV